MCGISAIISFEESDIVSNIFKMTDIIRHRGPDDEGFAIFGSNPTGIKIYGGADTPESVYGCGLNYTPKQKHPSEMHGKLALGHRRLSIIDLSAKGHQPMSYKNGRYWITYNGEIYNYIEIRAELVQKGHSFVSNTDTEVILAAYDEWGEDCLNHFNGMWAFVIYDSIGQKIFAARDRFGVKPLYIWDCPGKVIAMASEIKQFIVFPQWSSSMNQSRVYEFLVCGIKDHSEETFFNGVRQLKGGCSWAFNLKDKVQTTSKWYNLSSRIRNLNLPFEEAKNIFRDLFIDSVNLRMRADVKIGSCLSGGLDSSSIVCVVNQNFKGLEKPYSQFTVSACSNIQKYDEQEYIDEALKGKEIYSEKVFPSYEDLFENHPKVLWFQDEPFTTTSICSQWKVFEKSAAKGYKVMLDGQGGDEILAGYTMYFDAFFSELLSKAKIMEFLREYHGYKNNASGDRSGLLRFLAKFAIPEHLYYSLRSLNDKTESLLRWKGDRSYVHFFKKSVKEMSLEQMTNSDLQMLLHFEDRSSMSHGVETRLPFLDYRLVEFAISTPSSYKIHNGITKCLLRAAMKDILPEKILNRKDKMGFVTPEQYWMIEKKSEVEIKLKRACEYMDDLLGAPDKIINGFNNDVSSGRIPFGSIYWKLISLGEWIDLFKVRNK